MFVEDKDRTGQDRIEFDDANTLRQPDSAGQTKAVHSAGAGA